MSQTHPPEWAYKVASEIVEMTGDLYAGNKGESEIAELISKHAPDSDRLRKAAEDACDSFQAEPVYRTPYQVTTLEELRAALSTPQQEGKCPNCEHGLVRNDQSDQGWDDCPMCRPLSESEVSK